MPDVRPITWNRISQRVREMVAGETLAFALLSGVPDFARRNQDNTFRDVTAHRGNATGVVWLGNTGSRYLFFDGGNYTFGFPDGIDAVVWHSRNFNPGSKANVDGASTITVSQAFGPVDNNAYGGRHFIAVNTGTGQPGYGFHAAGRYGWFLYAEVDHFRGRRSDGMDVAIVHNGMGQRVVINDHIESYGANSGFAVVDRGNFGIVCSYYSSNGAHRIWNNLYGDAVAFGYQGTMARRNEAGGYTNVPQIFVQATDPGAASRPGDLWVIRV